MLVARTYVKNLFRGTFYAALLLIVILVALCVVAFVLWLALPNTMYSLLDYINAHRTGARHVTLFALLLFALYRFYKSIKRTGDFKRNLKFHIVTAIYAYAVYCACATLLITYFFHDYERCDYYNQKLDGGIKEFRGKKFKIDLCGTGGDSLQNDDKIRLEIFNGNGTLVALRHFVLDWDTPGFDKELQFHEDSITYFDMSDRNDSKRQISMPPTLFDWIQARIPFLD